MTTDVREYKLTFNRSDIKIIRWCLEVAVQAVSNQPEEAMTPEEGLGLVAWISQIDGLILTQILEGGEVPHIEGQMSFWDD